MITGDAIPAYNVPSGHPVRYPSRGRGQAAGRADQSRYGHVRRSSPRRLRDEYKGDGRSDRQARHVRRRGMAVLPDDHARKSRLSAQRRPTSAEIFPTNTRAAFSGRSTRRSPCATTAASSSRRSSGSPRRARLSPTTSSSQASWSTYIVVAPEQLQTTHTPYEPAISGEIFRPLSSFETPKFDIAKVIARRVAQELREGDAVNIGFGISANVPRILIEEGRHGAVTWVIEQGAVGGVPLLDFQFGCASNAEAIVQSPHQFTYFQGARLRHVAAFVPADRPRRLGQRLEARRASACDRGRRRLRRHHGARQEDRLLRLFHRGREARGPRRRGQNRQGRQGQEARRSGRADLVLRAARGRSRAGNRLRHRALRAAAREGRRYDHRARARRRSRARRSRPGRVSAARREGHSQRWTRRCSMPRRSIFSFARRRRRLCERLCRTCLRGTACAADAEARRQAERARPRDDRRARRRRARDRRFIGSAGRDPLAARARRSAPAATSPPGAVCRRSRCGATGRAPGIALSRRWRACAFR